MAYDTDMPTIPDEKILSRRPWYVIGAVLILISLLLRQPLLFIAGLLVAVLGAVPEIWYRFCLSAVTVRRTFSTQRAEIGDEVFLTLTIEIASTSLTSTVAPHQMRRPGGASR